MRKTNRDSFYQTHLQALLQDFGSDRLIICGLQTDYCVNATVRQALNLSYDVVLAAEDIIAQHNAELAHLTGPVARIDVIPASEIAIKN